jgi:hypothetical protein
MIKRFLIMLYSFMMYFFPRRIPNYGIIWNYVHFRFFQLSYFEIFLLYRGLWNTTEFRFSFNKWVINDMKISSVSEAAKINSINLRKHQIYTHQPLNRCLPRENRQHFPIYGIFLEYEGIVITTYIKMHPLRCMPLHMFKNMLNKHSTNVVPV